MSTARLRWPSLCAVCGAFGPGRLCATCIARFAPQRMRCGRCALPLDGLGDGHGTAELRLDGLGGDHGTAELRLDGLGGGHGADALRLDGVGSHHGPAELRLDGLSGDHGTDALQLDNADDREGPVATCGACLAQPPPFDAAVAGVDYRAPWDRLLADFKFHDAPELAGPLAARVLDAIRRRPDLAPDTIAPVPLARQRLAERGHNQAWELARRIARALGVPAEATLLVRVRATAHQLALPPAERAGNVGGAFAVDPSRAAAVAGRRLLVIDDVMTTGSTVAEIARVLRSAGAAFVAVAVVARVPRPGEP